MGASQSRSTSRTSGSQPCHPEARCCGLETRQDLTQETPQDDPVAAWRGSCWDPLPTPIGLQQC